MSGQIRSFELLIFCRFFFFFLPNEECCNVGVLCAEPQRGAGALPERAPCSQGPQVQPAAHPVRRDEEEGVDQGGAGGPA